MCEKGGNRHEIPCHYNLETYLTAYIERTEIANDPKGPIGYDEVERRELTVD